MFIDPGLSLELLAVVVRSVIMWCMSVNDSLVEWVSERAELLQSPLGNRWLHVQGVVKRAYWVGQRFDGEIVSLLLLRLTCMI